MSLGRRAGGGAPVPEAIVTPAPVAELVAFLDFNRFLLLLFLVLFLVFLEPVASSPVALSEPGGVPKSKKA